MAKQNILLVVDSIGQDGTGRFVTNLANGLAENPDYSVSVLAFHNECGAFYSSLSSSVNLVHMNLKGRIRYSLFMIAKQIVKLKPDFCFVLYTQILLLSFLAPYFRTKGIRIFFRETIIPSLYRGGINILHRSVICIAYRLYDKIIAQSNDMATDLVDNWWCKKESIIVINNPVSVNKLTQLKNELTCPKEYVDSDRPIYVSAGRLAPQKGYDIIIKRISEIEGKIPFKYFILGDGDLKEQLEEQIEEYNLGKTISLLGFKPNPFAYIYYSDALILSSRYEGFPNIVLEAMALGKPVLSNICLGGINEVIINGENGVACNFEDSEQFKKGLSEFKDCQFSSQHIIEITKDRYDEKIIIGEYISFLKAMTIDT